jgi:hypothetical protein
MKQLIRMAIAMLAAVFFFSACSSLSITKRRYTKGYYVEHRTNRTHQQHRDREAVQQQKTESENTVGTVVVKEKLCPPAAASSMVKASEAPAIQATKAPAVRKPILAAASSLAAPVVKKQIKALKQTISEFTADDSDDALSLLWILVVVILVLYLIGLLMELGPYTHILGVIALVLLILWLLRII